MRPARWFAAGHDADLHVLSPLSRLSLACAHKRLPPLPCSGICHSDLHQIRGEWGNSTWPMVPGHEVVGVVTEVGANVTEFAVRRGKGGLGVPSPVLLRAGIPLPLAGCVAASIAHPVSHTHTHTLTYSPTSPQVGDHAGVGCMVDSCRKCGQCAEGEEQFCPGSVFTYNSTLPDGTVTQGGYSTHMVVDKRWAASLVQGRWGRGGRLCWLSLCFRPFLHWQTSLCLCRKALLLWHAACPSRRCIPPTPTQVHAQGGQEPAPGCHRAAALRRHHDLLAHEALWPGGQAATLKRCAFPRAGGVVCCGRVSGALVCQTFALLLVSRSHRALSLPPARPCAAGCRTSPA